MQLLDAKRAVENNKGLCLLKIMQCRTSTGNAFTSNANAGQMQAMKIQAMQAINTIQCRTITSEHNKNCNKFKQHLK